MLKFPNSGSGRPYINLDARTGMWKISQPGGAEMINMQGQTLAMDIANAVQGWLHVGTGGADWQPITDGKWGAPPSPDHKPGVQMDVIFNGEVREFRGNSKATTAFVEAVYEAVDAAGVTKDGPIPLVRIDRVTLVKIGQGSSANVAFTLAQKANWTPRAALSGDDLSVEPQKPAAKGKADLPF